MIQRAPIPFARGNITETRYHWQRDPFTFMFFTRSNFVWEIYNSYEQYLLILYMSMVLID